jgi:hypothetical protein
MRLAQTVLGESRREPSQSGSILVVGSEADKAASLPLMLELVGNWRKFRPGVIETHVFPAEEKVPHDLIDPAQPNQQIALVYPILLKLLEK